MRYFKYKRWAKTYRKAKKAEIMQLPKAQRRRIYINDAWQLLGVSVFFLVAGMCCAVGFNLLLLIPTPQNFLLTLLYYFALFVAILLVLILGFLAGITLSGPIFSKTEYLPIKIGQSSMHQGCDHLRRYYGLQEPFIVTKCFACSDENFKNHDVCMFVYGDELRITADIHRGFAHGDRDLGCYAFRANEISLAKQEREGHLALELKADKVTFLLGYRAKGFIERNFLASRSLRHEKTLR